MSAVVHDACDYLRELSDRAAQGDTRAAAQLGKEARTLALLVNLTTKIGQQPDPVSVPLAQALSAATLRRLSRSWA